MLSGREGVVSVGFEISIPNYMFRCLDKLYVKKEMTMDRNGSLLDIQAYVWYLI